MAYGFQRLQRWGFDALYVPPQLATQNKLGKMGAERKELSKTRETLQISILLFRLQSSFSYCRIWTAWAGNPYSTARKISVLHSTQIVRICIVAGEGSAAFSTSETQHFHSVFISFMSPPQRTSSPCSECCMMQFGLLLPHPPHLGLRSRATHVPHLITSPTHAFATG